MKNKTDLSSAILPPVAEAVTLYLIREELKARKFFHVLAQVGIGECPFRPSLDKIIIRSIGLYDGTDAAFNLYNQVMEERSRKIEADADSITKQAMKAYHELISERNNRHKEVNTEKMSH